MKTAVVILGHAYRKKSGHSSRQIKRLNKGIEIFNITNADYIITTGGVGKSFNDTNTPMSILMADYLKKHDIPESKIYYEERSVNTYENALFIKEIIENDTINKLYIVTSWDHLLRSKLIFHKIYPDADIVMVNSDYYSGWWTIFDFFWQIAGLIKYFVVKIIKGSGHTAG